MDRSYRIAPDGRSVVCDAVLGSEDSAALGEAIARRRDELGRDELHDVAAVAELRSLMTLDDLLGDGRAGGSEAVLELTREQSGALCELAGSYVSERDGDGYQAPEERERIARLRGLAGPLMDLCCDFAAAEDEAREHLVTG